MGARSGFSGRERPPQARQGRAAHGAHTDVHRPAGAANRATTAAVEWQELLSERATEWMAQVRGREEVERKQMEEILEMYDVCVGFNRDDF